MILYADRSWLTVKVNGQDTKRLARLKYRSEIKTGKCSNTTLTTVKLIQASTFYILYLTSNFTPTSCISSKYFG
jgi:hypothetical protein